MAVESGGVYRPTIFRLMEYCSKGVSFGSKYKKSIWFWQGRQNRESVDEQEVQQGGKILFIKNIYKS